MADEAPRLKSGRTGGPHRTASNWLVLSAPTEMVQARLSPSSHQPDRQQAQAVIERPRWALANAASRPFVAPGAAQEPSRSRASPLLPDLQALAHQRQQSPHGQSTSKAGFEEVVAAELSISRRPVPPPPATSREWMPVRKQIPIAPRSSSASSTARVWLGSSKAGEILPWTPTWTAAC